MRKFGMALAIVAGMLLAPMAAHAQRAANNAPPPKPGDKAQKAKGMADAPALIAAAGPQCTVTDAQFMGTGATKGPDGKPVKQSVYEVACQQGMGYIIVSDPSKDKPSAYDCLASLGGNLKCTLPANVDPKAGLNPYVQAAGKTCSISDAKYIGTTPDGTTYYEVACAGAIGFRMGVKASGGVPATNDCLSLLGTASACTLQDKPAIIAGFGPVVAGSGKACQVSDVRWIGQSAKTNEQYVEVACGSSPGYVAVLDINGRYKSNLGCDKAMNLGGGCQFTDTTVAQTGEIPTYTRLAKKANYDCDVAKYRYIGTDTQNREVVELSCKNRPDGAIAVFADPGPSVIYDCVRAGATGQDCKLTDRSVQFAKYSNALASKGKGTCKVSDARWIGRTAAADFVETACTDGLPGWVIEMNTGSESANALLTCKQATSAGIACKLPTNLKGNG